MKSNDIPRARILLDELRRINKAHRTAYAATWGIAERFGYKNGIRSTRWLLTVEEVRALFSVRITAIEEELHSLGVEIEDSEHEIP